MFMACAKKDPRSQVILHKSSGIFFKFRLRDPEVLLREDPKTLKVLIGIKNHFISS